jgi:hypothetical protein
MDGQSRRAKGTSRRSRLQIADVEQSRSAASLPYFVHDTTLRRELACGVLWGRLGGGIGRVTGQGFGSADSPSSIRELVPTTSKVRG